jgi:hypothetical protein
MIYYVGNTTKKEAGAWESWMFWKNWKMLRLFRKHRKKIL